MAAPPPLGPDGKPLRFRRSARMGPGAGCRGSRQRKGVGLVLREARGGSEAPADRVQEALALPACHRAAHGPRPANPLQQAQATPSPNTAPPAAT